LLVLTELMRVEKEKNVRRSAVSCLGELLFYIATQEPPEKPWNIPPATVSAVIKAIKSNEDEAVLQYVLQTIENVRTFFF
jgi:hypothetical protein